MTSSAWLTLIVLIAMLAISTPLLGSYLAKVYTDGRSPGHRFFHAIERPIYRVCGVDEDSEQRWQTYAIAMLAFSFVSLVVLYVQLRVQRVLPLNPDSLGAVKPSLAFDTSVSFLTNTNWQNYSGETTMSYLSQMAGLAFHNFVSAAVGATVAVALIRGLVRSRSRTIGNFWVDLVRTCTRVLLPLSFVAALVFVSQGVVQNFHATKTVTTVTGEQQHIPGGPVASQEGIKEAGENGGGPYNANSAHPYENPNGFTNIFQIWLLLALPFAFPWMFGRMVGDRRQGLAVLGAMFVLWLAGALIAMPFEAQGNPQIAKAGVTQTATAAQSGGNMECKEVRFGAPTSALFAASTTGTSTGSVDSMHDCFTPLGGAAPLVNMMLGEVSPGGTGA